MSNENLTGTKSFISPFTVGGQFGQYNMMQKAWKMTVTLAHGYSSDSSQQGLPDEYQHDRVKMCNTILMVLK